MDVKAGEKVYVRKYLDLPLVVEFDPCPADVREGEVQLEKRDPSFHIDGCSTVHLMDERGKEIKQVNIGDMTSVPFVDERLLVFLSQST